MTDKDGNISDTMRSIADLLDDHGDKIDPIVDKFVGGTVGRRRKQRRLRHACSSSRLIFEDV